MTHTKAVINALVIIIMVCMSACCGANTPHSPYEPPTYRPLPTLSTGMTTSEVLQLWGEPQEKQVVKSDEGKEVQFWHYRPPAVSEHVMLRFSNDIMDDVSIE